ncbi:MAG: CBS domain-containing protein [Candidatus Thermoplasmatota archaeon]|nr:CBS domain-containing protein [Candidatus Thermoplasmatota archaeon]
MGDEDTVNMKIKDVMTTEIISIDKDVNLRHVLKLMKKHEVTKIPVVEEKKLIGTISDNTIAMKLGSKRKAGVPASRLHASSVTDKQVEVVTPTTSVKTILQKVGEPGPTMLIVMEKDTLVGVVTKADLLPLVTSTKKLKEIMQKKLHMVSSDDRVVHARRIMIDNNIARLPVINDGKLVGLISDMEIAFAFAALKRSFPLGRQKHQLDELLVKDVMKSPVIWAEPGMTAIEAAKVMLKHNIGALPLLKGNTIVGIVTRTDLLKTI